MPPEKEGGKLPDEVIADFEKWIRMGAPDPRDGTRRRWRRRSEWDMKKAKEFWAFQPPKAASAAGGEGHGVAAHGRRRFILAALEAKGLKPVADADRTHAAAARLFRSHRPAADAGGGRTRS